ncbi:4630_t:CDS:1, partial [Cetraspora pellucida]
KVFSSQLQIQIALDELRPPILDDTETCFVSLMRQRWDKNVHPQLKSLNLLRNGKTMEKSYWN